MNKFWGWVIGLVIVAILAISVGSQFITRIPAGYVGVVYSANGGVQDETLPQGWHMIGFFDKVIHYPIRLQTVEYKDIQVATSDGKNVTMDFAYNYQIEPSKVIEAFNTFGPISVNEIEESYLRTRLWDAARKGISKFTVIDVYGEKSSDAAVSVQKIYSDQVDDLGFMVTNLTVGVPQPDVKTQEAIDARVQASQELERKETELQIAQKEAERKFAEAQGIANAQIEEARGIAESNKMIQQSITQELIEYEEVKKWDGKLPTVQAGDSGLMLNVSPSN